MAGLDQRQHAGVQQRARLRAVGQGLGAFGKHGFAHAPLGGPQIGRMHLVVAGQRLRRAVLGKQRNGGHGPAGQQRIEVFEQGKAGVLQRAGRFGRAALGVLLQPQHRGFHRMHQARGSAQVDHFQRAADLVQRLLHGQRVKRCLTILGREFGLARETRQQLGRAFQRFAQFIDDPCQGSEILLALRSIGRGFLGGLGKEGVSGRHAELRGGLTPV